MACDLRKDAGCNHLTRLSVILMLVRNEGLVILFVDEGLRGREGVKLDLEFDLIVGGGLSALCDIIFLTFFFV